MNTFTLLLAIQEGLTLKQLAVMAYLSEITDYEPEYSQLLSQEVGITLVSVLAYAKLPWFDRVLMMPKIVKITQDIEKEVRIGLKLTPEGKKMAIILFKNS
jgi:hypothetical protein